MIRKLCLAFIVAVSPAAAQSTLTPSQLARIDSIFSRYNANDVPGCALGISRNDSVILERAWGMAELEHSIPITPATIFEAGSVSKQFTAAAIFRLAQQGRLSLDSSVRKYVPELPAYTQPITLRHLVTHTSGLRDWGTVMAIAGWPRGTRTYTHAHVLDIIARQTALNYPVGTEYLYSNSNYSLLTIIAERVSGMSLAQFTKKELFDPLGMKSSGWRDNYTTIVKGRAQAYGGSGKSWRLTMPFENVYGHSSLLTTVGDLLKWSANFKSRQVGGDEFVKMQLTHGLLASGRRIGYSGGVMQEKIGGHAEIMHDGSTAGYRAFLARYPDAGYSIAMLCNAGNTDPLATGRAVAAIVLPSWTIPPAAKADSVGKPVEEARLASMVGYYRHPTTDDPLRLVLENGRLRVVEGPLLTAVSDTHFTTPSGRTHFVWVPGSAGKPGTFRGWVDQGDTIAYEPLPPPLTSPAEYAGNYYSAEADAALSIQVAGDSVVMFQRPSTRTPLQPIYRDGFSALGSIIKFTRSSGRVDGFLVTSGRARNVRFDLVRH